MTNFFATLGFVFFTLSFSIASASSGTGYDVGNGGIGVFCSNPKMQKATFLDVFELHQTKAIIDPFIAMANRMDSIQNLLIRLNEKCPQSIRWEIIYYSLVQQTIFLNSNESATDEFINNANGVWYHHFFGTAPLPQSCQYKVIAIQTQSPNAYSQLLRIETNLYAQLPDYQKATLWVHEAIFRAFIMTSFYEFYSTPTHVRELVKKIIQSDYRTQDYSEIPICHKH